MLDQKLLEMMYESAMKSGLEGAHSAALIYRKMLDMPVESQVIVQFQEGEDFVVTRKAEGYELA